MRLGSLIIKIGLDGVERARAALRGIRGNIKEVADTATDAGKKIHDGLTMPFEGAMRAASSATGAFGAVSGIVGGLFASSAVKAATDYAGLAARLEAVAGSAERAKRVLSFAQTVAGPSPFTFSQLAESATMLEAFGVNSLRVLPIVGRLGAVFGAGSEQIDMFTRAIGELAQGNALDADVRAAMGLTNADFMAQGVQFDGNGKLLSSANTALTALENIVNTRYGGIFDKMANTPTAKLASLQDSWEKFLRVIGDGILTRLAPAIDYATKLLGALTSSGILEQTVAAFNAGLGRLFNLQPGDGFLRFVASTLSVIQTLPDYIKVAYDNTKAFFTNLGEDLAAAFDLGAAKVNSITEVVMRNLTVVIGAVKDLMSGNLVSAAGWVGKLSLDPNMALQGMQEDAQKRYDAALANRPAYGKLPGLLGNSDAIFGALKSAFDAQGNGMSGNIFGSGDFLTRGQDTAAQATRSLDRIERNTRDAADALTLRRATFGGGEMARIGATDTELFGTSRPPGGASMPFALRTPEDFGRAFARYVDAKAEQRARQIVAAGAGAPGRFRPR